VFWVAYISLVVLAGAAAGFALAKDSLNRALIILVFLGGFHGLFWLLRTGNPGILELPLAVMVVIAFAGARFRLAGIALGAVAGFKLLPLIYAIAFAVAPISIAKRARAFAYAVLTFGALQLANAALWPSLMPSFLAQLRGQIPNQHSAFAEKFYGQNDPNFIEF